MDEEKKEFNPELSSAANAIVEKKTDQIIQPKFAKTGFAEKMDDVKLDVLQDAKQNDVQFVETIKTNLKKAAVTATEVEQEKQELEKSQVVTEQKKEEQVQQKVEHEKNQDVWQNRRNRRQYHYDGVAPIMKSVEINEPLNLFVLYFLTVVLIIPYLIGKFIRGTFGVLISGNADGNRPKAVKGFIWTLIGLFLVALLGSLVYLFLKWQQVV